MCDSNERQYLYTCSSIFLFLLISLMLLCAIGIQVDQHVYNAQFTEQKINIYEYCTITDTISLPNSYYNLDFVATIPSCSFAKTNIVNGMCILPNTNENEYILCNISCNITDNICNISGCMYIVECINSWNCVYMNETIFFGSISFL